MADNHYEVDETLKPARDLMDAIRMVNAGWDKLRDARLSIIQQKDNAASGDAVYAKIATRYGFAGADTAAKQASAAAAFSEIDADFGNSDAAVSQLAARFL